jgi:hypothetical protein
LFPLALIITSKGLQCCCEVEVCVIVVGLGKLGECACLEREGVIMQRRAGLGDVGLGWLEGVADYGAEDRGFEEGGVEPGGVFEDEEGGSPLRIIVTASRVSTRYF